MKITNINKCPEGYTYSTWYDLEDLSKYDINELKKLGIEEAWYWYGVGSDEGDGAMVMRKGSLYATHDLSHCSCYGPCDLIEPLEWLSIEELKVSMTDECMYEYAALFELAESML